MKNISITLYSFNELSDNAKENIISTWRYNDEYFWSKENDESLKEFCNLFNINVTGYDYGYHNYINAKFNLDDNILELSSQRLATYIWNNYKNALYKGKYYSKYSKSRNSKIQLSPNDCSLTGYYIDQALIDPIIEFMSKPDGRSFERLLNDCLDNWLLMCKRDYDYWLSSESIIEDIEFNDYLFLANGNLASREYQEAA